MKSGLWVVLLLAALVGLFSLGCDCGDDDDDDSNAGDDDVVDDDDTDDDDTDDDDTDDDDSDDDDTDDDDSDDDDVVENCELVQDDLDDGRWWLGAADGTRAREYYRDALEVAPNCREAIYGNALANGHHVVSVFGVVYDYIRSLEYGGPVKATVTDSDDIINGIVAVVVDGFLNERAVECMEYADKAVDVDATFEHESIPIFIAFTEEAELAGTFEDAELQAFKAFSGIFSGLLLHLTAVDLDLDISSVFRLTDVDTSLPTDVVVAGFVDIIMDLLTDPGYPDFLTIPAENAEVFKEAGLQVGDGLNAWLATFEAIEAGTGDQTERVIGYDDANDNGVYDQGEAYVFPHYGALDQEQMEWALALLPVMESLRDSFWDGTVSDVDPNNPNPFQANTLNGVLNLLGIPSLIPASLTLDIGAMYVDPAGTGLRDFLVTVGNILQAFLPTYPW